MKFLLSLAFLAIPYGNTEAAIEVPYGSQAHFESHQATNSDVSYSSACPCLLDAGSLGEFNFVNVQNFGACGASPEGVFGIGSEEKGVYVGATTIEGTHYCATGTPPDTALSKQMITENQFEACKNLIVSKCWDIDLPWVGSDPPPEL